MSKPPAPAPAPSERCGCVRVLGESCSDCKPPAPAPSETCGKTFTGAEVRKMSARAYHTIQRYRSIVRAAQDELHRVGGCEGGDLRDDPPHTELCIGITRALLGETP